MGSWDKFNALAEAIEEHLLKGREDARPASREIAEAINDLGFPENEPTPKFDLVYSGATRLPGYKYRPIYAPQDHPQAVKDRKGDSVQ